MSDSGYSELGEDVPCARELEISSVGVFLSFARKWMKFLHCSQTAKSLPVCVYMERNHGLFSSCFHSYSGHSRYTVPLLKHSGREHYWGLSSMLRQ